MKSYKEQQIQDIIPETIVKKKQQKMTYEENKSGKTSLDAVK